MTVWHILRGEGDCLADFRGESDGLADCERGERWFARLQEGRVTVWQIVRGESDCLADC